MSEPISYRLLDALRTRVQQITVDNGYRTDIGANVLLEGPWQEGDGPTVFISAGEFSEGKTSNGRGGKATRQSTVDLLFEILVPTSSGNGTRDAHRAREDLIRALSNAVGLLPTHTDGSATASLTIGVQRFSPRADGASVIAVQIIASAGLTEYLITPTP